MVQHQLVARGIADQALLQVMGRIPREQFVPTDQLTSAYADGALPIGRGQTISQPYIVALMTAALHLTGRERVLEVGTGSGYQTAVLAELAEHVYTIERIAPLSSRARGLLRCQLNYGNVSLRVGDGTLGWPEEAPFDRILVTAGAPRRPEALLAQLASGGEAVIPVGPEHHQVLIHYRRETEHEIRERHLTDCVFVKLIGDEGW
jgi:protein-L-isoaspartate(D-aspartate) O-methyltransferase